MWLPKFESCVWNTCVLRLTSAAGYNDSLSFALHPDGSNHNWVYDTAEGKESLILWGTINLTDISVIHAPWIYFSVYKEPMEMAELRKNDSNNNRNSKLKWLYQNISRSNLKNFHTEVCYHFPAYADISFEVRSSDMVWPTCLRQELVGDFEMSEAKTVWLLAPDRRHLILHRDVLVSA